MAAHPAEHVFTERQWHEIQALIGNLDSRQALWLSGYLAALGKSAAPSAQPNSGSGASILIAYGSETGNSEKLAHQLSALAAEQGIATTVKSLATLRPRQLGKYQYVLLICSTHGDGDPPEPITAFYASLMEDAAPRMPDVHYAVLALGDSSYEHFCVTGKQLDERLAALGATRIIFRQDCDVDYAAPARLWMDNVLKALPRDSAATNAAPQTEPVKTAQYGKDQPLTVTVLDNIRLSHEKRSDANHHLELLLEVEDFHLEPGDAVGIFASNPAPLVEAVITAAGLTPEQTVTAGQRSLPLAQALGEIYDLCIPSKNFLTLWAQLSGSEALAALVAGEAKPQREFLRSHQLLDIMREYPAKVEAQALVDNLRPLQPRLYDVANSLAATPDELHLTVKRYSYEFRGRDQAGIASHYLADLPKQAALRLYPHRNARFHLPEQHDVPLVLIADGTGIAPYRAFLQEIGAGERSHRVWLAFAENRFEEDFLYQTEWQQAKADGLLERVDTVFYQDEPGRTLASVIAESGQLADWLNAGAHLYFCGDKALLEACESELQAYLAGNGAAVDWQAIVADKRLHRNLY